jgi:hypothetical protein
VTGRTTLTARELRDLLDHLDDVAARNAWLDYSLTAKLEQMYAERASWEAASGYKSEVPEDEE